MSAKIDGECYITIKIEDYYKLIASKLIQEVINKSISFLKASQESNLDQNTIDLNSIEFSLCEEKKSNAWNINFSNDSIEKYSYTQNLLNLNNSLNSSNSLKTKKYLNKKRWNCISRPQYKYSCGISSLVSCWNYLYSNLGVGRLNPLTQEQALTILGFKEPYNEIRFGPFTGNSTLIKWFDKLNSHFSVIGKASMFYKPVGKNKTFGMTSQIANQRIENLLHSKSVSFIYHCYNHYITPVGYEHESLDCTQIYTKRKNIENVDYINWILLADTSRKYPSIHCVKWEDIATDLNTKSPEYLNIRHLERGLQVRECKQKTNESKSGGNLHCIIKFESFSSSTELGFDRDQMQINCNQDDSDESEENENSDHETI